MSPSPKETGGITGERRGPSSERRANTTVNGFALTRFTSSSRESLVTSSVNENLEEALQTSCGVCGFRG
ncbi:hypothetical protein I79_007128 [Cricetulus griseus]|uniref:Uncharacterized protein n=1 Tax=Cricetulus griseus TaxID=10029 RepID=G3H9P9_CRIGR|nr:hypothetical protein I79_007128 [Cricetulus griseus]